MSINRLPIFVWGTLTTSFSMLFALPALTVACVMLYFDRRFGMHFFDASTGGHPMLWQHLFWIFGHPVGLHHRAARHGPHVGPHPHLLPPSARRLHLRGARDGRDRDSRLRGVGAPHVQHRACPRCPPTSSAPPAWSSRFRARSRCSPGSRRSGTAGPFMRTPFLFAAGFIVLFVIGGRVGRGDGRGARSTGR